MAGSRPGRRARGVVVPVVLALVLAATGGCAPAGTGGTSSATCVSWVWFESPADASTAADLVVRARGTAGERGAAAERGAVGHHGAVGRRGTAGARGAAGERGTAEAFGVAAAVHTVRVSEVLGGTGVEVGDEVDVVSTPATCTGDGAYPDGDPLDAPGDLVLLLHHDDETGGWRTLTPMQGAVPPAPDGGLPTAWPEASTAG